MEERFKVKVTNYLDDFLFMTLAEEQTNELVRHFLKLYAVISVPISEEKTEWSSSLMTFLGILLDGKNHLLAIPQEKRIKAINILKMVISQCKITIHWIQKLRGLLNFVQRAIVPGRAFTRRMYDKLTYTDKKGKPLKQYHHVVVDKNAKKDCNIWL